jgi:hypothetical protein
MIPLVAFGTGAPSGSASRSSAQSSRSSSAMWWVAIADADIQYRAKPRAPARSRTARALWPVTKRGAPARPSRTGQEPPVAVQNA